MPVRSFGPCLVTLLLATSAASVFVGASALAAAPTSTLDPAASHNWPRWRGPLENGHTPETGLPVKWTESDIAWKTPLPGSGQSSPVVWGDRIFLTTALDQGKERVVLGLDRHTGKILWQQSAWKGEPEKVHIMNGWASSTCVTDGEIVIAFFGRGGIHAYSVDGKPLWQRDLGKFESPWGVSACPILVDDMVVQNCDADVGGYITALDKRTGKTIWRTERPLKTDPTKSMRGWSTPIVITTGGRREIVINGHDGVRAYDPATGRELWYCKSFNGRGEPTVTPAGDLLCVVNGLGGDFYSIRPGGEGDVTKTHMAWHTPRKGGRDCPSPIVIGKFVIVVDMKGLATCYDAADGHVYWKERIVGQTGNVSASPIAAGGLAYFVLEDGRTIVIKPGEKLEIVAESSIPHGDEEIFRSSPTPSNGQLLIRSTTMLYAIGKAKR